MIKSTPNLELPEQTGNKPFDNVNAPCLSFSLSLLLDASYKRLNI